MCGLAMITLTSAGPIILIWKYLAFDSSGVALIPGTGSAIKRCVSCQSQKVCTCIIVLYLHVYSLSMVTDTGKQLLHNNVHVLP